MAGVLDTVNQRTQLVGKNRLELLLFNLEGDQLYGINVFKVKEVLKCPHLTEMPKRSAVVRGVAHIRGTTIPIIDLNLATGSSALKNHEECYCIIAEYNSTIQGFLVHSVERIVNMEWGDIHAPPRGSGRESYLTAVAKLDGKIIEIIDVEKILVELSPSYEPEEEKRTIKDENGCEVPLRVLVVDDSGVARKQIKRCVEALGCEVELRNDGLQALQHLQQMVADGIDIREHYLMIISDIEMPEMDGYTLTSRIRSNNAMEGMHIILHSSLSGVFNSAMVEKVGANDFLSKFNPAELADKVGLQITNYLKNKER